MHAVVVIFFVDSLNRPSRHDNGFGGGRPSPFSEGMISGRVGAVLQHEYPVLGDEAFGAQYAVDRSGARVVIVLFLQRCFFLKDTVYKERLSIFIYI